MKKAIILVLGVVLCAVVAGAEGVNLVSNPDFKLRAAGGNGPADPRRGSEGRAIARDRHARDRRARYGSSHRRRESTQNRNAPARRCQAQAAHKKFLALGIQRASLPQHDWS